MCLKLRSFRCTSGLPRTHLSKGRPPKSNRYSVLQVRYLYRKPTQFSAKEMVARGAYEPRWEILIHEVPREHCRAVQRLLDTEGLSRVRQWLNARSHLTGREGWHNFAIIFDETQQSLSFEEEAR